MHKNNRSSWNIVCLLFVAYLTPDPASAATRSVSIGFVGESGGAAHLGVLQGLQESNLQGRFLGQSYSAEIFDSAAALIAADKDWDALIAAADVYELTALERAFADRAIFNLQLDDDELRAVCSGNVLHVVPSRQMKADAVRQWRSLHPRAKVEAAAWHRDFKKYAASQLNIRFTEAHGQSMDDSAWAGWAAIKMLSDMVAREPQVQPDSLLDALRERLAFDGQKGAEMSFRETGQLRQPLLLVEGGKLVGEAPVRGVADIANLDSLGQTLCPK